MRREPHPGRTAVRRSRRQRAWLILTACDPQGQPEWIALARPGVSLKLHDLHELILKNATPRIFWCILRSNFKTLFVCSPFFCTELPSQHNFRMHFPNISQKGFLCTVSDRKSVV